MNEHLSKIISNFTKDAHYILQDNVIEKYLFGSYAKNQYTPESDIDILIIINNYNIEFQYKLSELASDYSINYGVYISPILKDFELWKKNKQYNTLFYQEIAKAGIKLWFMSQNYSRDLSSHRLKKSKDLIIQAKLFFDNKQYDGCINRSYYSHRSTSFVFFNYLISLTILFPRSSVGTFFSRSSVKW